MARSIKQMTYEELNKEIRKAHDLWAKALQAEPHDQILEDQLYYVWDALTKEAQNRAERVGVSVTALKHLNIVM